MESRSAGRLPQLGSLYRGFSDTLKMILSDAFLESTKHKNGHTSSGGNGTQQKHSSFVWCERTSKFSPRLDSACHLMSGGSTAGITLESFLESHENTKAKIKTLARSLSNLSLHHHRCSSGAVSDPAQSGLQ